jgi:adenylate cyclase
VAKKSSRFFETKYFGLIIGVLVFALLLILSTQTVLISNLELNVLDFNFRLKNFARRTRVQEGVTLEQRNPKISPDILIIGIDDKSLDTFGRWPFPRYTEANLINTFAKIRNQSERERALFLDIFFIEPSVPEHDVLMVQSIAANQRVFLESVLTRVPNPAGTEQEYFERQDILYERFGKITTLEGDWTQVETLYGVYPPLKPYARVAYGYGHPNFVEDNDQVYRKQPMVVKSAVLLEEIPLDDLTPGSLTEEERKNFTRLAWIDTEEVFHDVSDPLTEQVIENLRRTMEKKAPLKAEDTNNDKQPDRYYHVVRKYRDSFLPAITLALALDYFNKDLSDIEVVLGKHVRIPSPQQFNIETQSWEPYQLLVKSAVVDQEGNVVRPAVMKPMDEIKIPINDKAQLLINYMGIASSASPQGHQTFPVRSFAGYAARVPNPDPARWPRTMAVGNRILMVGPFSKGIAEDEKTTPYGLMFGVDSIDRVHGFAASHCMVSGALRGIGGRILLRGYADLRPVQPDYHPVDAYSGCIPVFPGSHRIQDHDRGEGQASYSGYVRHLRQHAGCRSDHQQSSGARRSGQGSNSPVFRYSWFHDDVGEYESSSAGESFERVPHRHDRDHLGIRRNPRQVRRG